MPKHIDYLAKANRLDELIVHERPLLSEDGALPSLKPSAPSGSNQWMRVARFLERSKPENELVSVGVFPATDATDESGSFVIGLAISLRTRYSCKVVIVDLNLEGSELAIPLGAPTVPGVWEALQSEPDLRVDCIHETSAEDVGLIPSGVVTPVYRAKEFERRLRWLDGALARTHPIIIYRFPRARQMRELQACFQVPHISLLTVTPGVSRRSEVRRESEALREAGANLVGVVLTEESRWRGK